MSQVGTTAESSSFSCLPIATNKNPYLSLPFNNALTIHSLLSDCESALQGNYLNISSKRSYKTPVCPNKRPVWHCSPSLILAQGLRGLQQSAATLTGSFYLIGFDIKNYHKQQKIHPQMGYGSCFQRFPFFSHVYLLLCCFSTSLISEISYFMLVFIQLPIIFPYLFIFP